MASALHRATRQYEPSIDLTRCPIIDWIHNPDISAVEGWPIKYWNIVGDVITLMSQAERDAADATEIETNRDAKIAGLSSIPILRDTFAEMLQLVNEARAAAGISTVTTAQFRDNVRNR